MEQTKINWVTTLFLILTPLAGVIGTTFLAMHHAIMWPTIVLALIFTVISGLSITCGYHRLFSHLAYKAHWMVRFLFAIFGASAFEGSILEWCTDHRNHHRYTDTDKDPYNAKRGFWFSHLGWLIYLDPTQRDFSNVGDLTADPIVQWQHRHYVKLAICSGFLLPMVLAWLWGDLLGGLIIAGALRISINHHFTFCINSVCHIFGKTTYSDRNTAKDNWFTALFTYGEGYHNFHHKFPVDFRNGIRFYDFDPSKWLIGLLAAAGLANELKTVSQHRIIQCRIEMEESALHNSIKENSKFELIPLLNQARDSVMQALAKLEDLEKSYNDLKQNRLAYVNDKWAEYKHLLRDYRTYLRKSKRDLNRSLKLWSKFILQSTA